MRFSNTFTIIFTAVFLAAGGARSGAAQPLPGELEKLAAHKAIYDVRLATRTSDSQVLNISGKMYFEWKPGCDAWTTDHRFNLDYEYADSPPMKVSSDFSTYEPFDGKSLNFTARRSRDGALFQELRGKAEIGTNGAGEAVYTMPEDLAFDLPKGILFPSGHTIALLKAIHDGKKFLSATTFDGSDEDGPVEINTFVGKETPAPAQIDAAPEIDAALLKTKSWTIRMAFFPLSQPDAGADYEMTARFHENGIITDMDVEYHDFSVTQKLVALESVKTKACDEKQGTEAR